MNLADWNLDDIESTARWARTAGVRGLQIRPILGVPHTAPAVIGIEASLIRAACGGSGSG
jgi:hypothetical protein